MEKFEYSPLLPGEIRLMHLEPAKKFDAPLRCTLVTEQLEQAHFEALSYVWGSQEDVHTLFCHEKNLSITRNLETALRYIRRKWRSRLLWIDAVCINQIDIREKEEQVQRMGRIYTVAAHSLIWLGEANVHLARAFRFFAGIQLLGEEDSIWWFNGFAGYRAKLMEKILCVGARPELYQAVSDLCGRAWFNRVWTFQELVVNAKPVAMCGKHTLLWSELNAIYTALAFPDRTLNDRYNIWFRFSIAHPQEIVDLTPAGAIDLLIDIRASLASEARDHVYGVNAIIERVGCKAPSVDYLLDVAALYAAATRTWLEPRDHFLCLGLAAKGRSMPGLPSWAFDWGQSVPDGSVFSRRYGLYDQLVRAPSATRSVARKRIVESCGMAHMELDLRGIVVAQVKTHIAPISHGKKIESALLYGSRWLSTIDASPELPQILAKWILFLCPVLPSATPTSHSLDACTDRLTEQTLRTLRCLFEEKAFDQDSPSTTLVSAVIRLAVEHRLIDQDSVLDWTSLGYKLNRNINLRLVSLTLRDAATTETLFATDTGEFGTCYCTEMRDGDVVTLIVGSDFPIVLRPAVDRDGYYELVGLAIVTGMMNGELWSEDTNVEELPVITLV